MRNLYFGLMFFVIVLSAAGQNSDPVIKYYGEIGCNHCDLFEEKILPGIEEKSGVTVELQAFDILDPDYYEICEKELAAMGLEFSIFPVLFVGNNAYLGNSALEAGLEDELIYYRENGEFRPFSSYLSTSSGSVTISVIPVFIAGLIDGVNPCAFATLVFFISFLSIQGRTKREILITGILFTSSVFAAYFLLGLGLLNAVRLLVDTSLMRFILKIIVSLVTAVFLILSLRDYYLAKKGRYDEINLQLSIAMKRRIHRVIRKNNGKVLLMGGVIITGFTVSVIELACTGQVYLPTIAYMIQTDSSALGLRSLLIYNTGFVLPLIFVFYAVYRGLSSSALTAMFSGKIGHAKLVMAFLFLLLTVVIWLV